jgi:hypothetical protein
MGLVKQSNHYFQNAGRYCRMYLFLADRNQWVRLILAGQLALQKLNSETGKTFFQEAHVAAENVAHT